MREYYLEHDNTPRRRLVGHSQGWACSRNSFANEIDASRFRRGSYRRAAWDELRCRGARTSRTHFACRCAARRSRRCVISYASFRSTIPPPADSLFVARRARTWWRLHESGGARPRSGALHAYLSSKGRSITGSAAARSWVTPEKSIDTPLSACPGCSRAVACRTTKARLSRVTVHGDSSDPRTDDISGDVVRDGQVQANWGLAPHRRPLAMGTCLLTS